jgi:hypothetical protein
MEGSETDTSCSSEEGEKSTFDLNIGEYYVARHWSYSHTFFPQYSRNIALTMSLRAESLNHHRQPSTDRSLLWHGASRRFFPHRASSTSFNERPTLPSRKQCSLMIDPANQQQSPSFPPQSPERRHQTWYYSSNHVLVNRERVANGLPPLHRRVTMDERARQVAAWAAQGKSLKGLISGQDSHTFCSGNVLVGSSIRAIHEQTLERTHCQRERRNLLNPDYTEFGIGTYKDSHSGQLVLCQLFGAGGKASF